MTVVKGAIWNRDGVSMQFQRSGQQRNSLVLDIVEGKKTADVKTVTLDTMVKEVGWHTVEGISCTVNGAEIEAVQGMAEVLRAQNPVRLSIAGWYLRDGQRIADILVPQLQEFGLRVRVGIKGGVYAWKI